MVGKSARARAIIDRRGAGAASGRCETAARQRPLSPAQRVFVPGVFLRLPTALLRPSAPPICRFPSRIFAPSAFLLLPTAFLLPRHRVGGSPWPPFRVYFSSLAAAKGFVLLNIRARRPAPLVVIVRGAQLFLAFLSVVSCLLRPFSFAEAVFSRSDAEFPCRCAGFSVGRGCDSLALMFAFATSCGGVGCFAQRFCGLAPRCSGSVHRFASVRRGAVEKARRFSTYPQFVFHRLFHSVEKMSTTLCVFHRLSVFPPQGAPAPSRRADEKCPRARVYII